MTTQTTGVISKWQDDKGFGFIELTQQNGDSIFFHISDYQSQSNTQRRPTVGDKVRFEISEDHKGRLRATQVQAHKLRTNNRRQNTSTPNKAVSNKNSSNNTARNKHTRAQQSSRHQSYQDTFKSGQSNRLFIGIGFYSVLTFIAFIGSISWFVVGWYGLLGIVTFLIYAKDKSAAQNGKWRTPEATLHVLSLLGGWVGAMLAQTYLRHKSQKPEFRIMYYLTVIINLAGLLFLLAGGDIGQFIT